eukprot:360197-Chlamydomonas_euryale.AAC.3
MSRVGLRPVSSRRLALPAAGSGGGWLLAAPCIPKWSVPDGVHTAFTAMRQPAFELTCATQESQPMRHCAWVFSSYRGFSGNTRVLRADDFHRRTGSNAVLQPASMLVSDALRRMNAIARVRLERPPTSVP